MKLTAVRYAGNGQLIYFISFYAAIDTGATRSLSSRELSEKLYGIFDASDYKKFHMFNGDSVRYEVMTRKLDLVKFNSEVVSLGLENFIHHNLPFSQYLPKSDKLPQRLDMILGSKIAWKYTLNLPWENRYSKTLQDGINNALDFDLGKF